MHIDRQTCELTSAKLLMKTQNVKHGTVYHDCVRHQRPYVNCVIILDATGTKSVTLLSSYLASDVAGGNV